MIGVKYKYYGSMPYCVLSLGILKCAIHQYFLKLYCIIVYVVYLAIILIWLFGIKIAKLTVHHYPAIYTAYMVSFHKVLKSTNLKSRQLHYLSKLPNIRLANNSTYTMYCDSKYCKFAIHQYIGILFLGLK